MTQKNFTPEDRTCSKGLPDSSLPLGLALGPAEEELGTFRREDYKEDREVRRKDGQLSGLRAKILSQRDIM